MNSSVSDLVTNTTGSLIILVLSFLSVWMRIRRGLLLTGVTGLLMSAMLFLGIGPICYLTVYISHEHMTVPVVSKHMAEVVPSLVVGFVLVFLNELRNRKKQFGVQDPEEAPSHLRAVIFFYSIALLGFFLSQTALATAGAGTIFPVFRLFLYPSLIMAVYYAQVSRPMTVVVALIILITGFYFTLISIWRSQLILYFGSIAIGLLQRSRKYQLPVAGGVVVVLLVLLPFQHLKKVEYSKVRGNLIGTFTKTFTLGMEKRLAFAGEFFAERINNGREIAYVHHALVHNWIQKRDGETYFEMGLQLIPRSLWPGKPSFNFFTNYYLPRRIGLVGEEDDYTSWGVNVYAEFIMNFDYHYLPVFIVILFWVVSGIDKLIRSIYRNPLVKWIAATSFFFITFEMVGIVNVTTYIIWMLILAKLTEYVFRMRWGRTFLEKYQFTRG